MDTNYSEHPVVYVINIKKYKFCNNYFITKTKKFGFIKLLHVSAGSCYDQDYKNK